MDIVPLMGDEDAKHREEIRSSFAPAHHAPAPTRWLPKLFRGVRKLFVFLLGAAIVTTVICHRNEIASKTDTLIQQVKNRSAADSLRKSALSYEQQVDEVAK